MLRRDKPAGCGEEQDCFALVSTHVSAAPIEPPQMQADTLAGCRAHTPAVAPPAMSVMWPSTLPVKRVSIMPARWPCVTLMLYCRAWKRAREGDHVSSGRCVVSHAQSVQEAQQRAEQQPAPHRGSLALTCCAAPSSDR